jgi:uncharacterized membrane protein HdeD (DUF308 family)
MPADLQPPTDFAPFASAGGNWREFVVVGAILVACGVAAILAPAVANFATSTLLGTLLVIAGGACVYQAMHSKVWAGYNWQLLLGAGELVGGIFIIINPLKGAAAVTLLVAIVVIALGVSQIGLALKIRPQSGWAWLVGAGLVSLLLGGALIARFPFSLTENPGVMAGISLVGGGVAHAMIGISQRIARGPPWTRDHDAA